MLRYSDCLVTTTILLVFDEFRLFNEIIKLCVMVRVFLALSPGPFHPFYLYVHMKLVVLLEGIPA